MEDQIKKKTVKITDFSICSKSQLLLFLQPKISFLKVFNNRIAAIPKEGLIHSLQRSPTSRSHIQTTFLDLVQKKQDLIPVECFKINLTEGKVSKEGRNQQKKKKDLFSKKS